MKGSGVLRLQLELESPLFIGDGDTLSPLSYLTDERKIYVVNVERFLKQISDTERQAYLEWLEPILDEMEKLGRRQRRQIASRLSIQEFIQNRLHREPVSLLQTLDCIAYTMDAPMFRGGFIHTFTKNADGSPFIPGTEIKGALRTSLLYYLLKEDRLLYKALRQRLSQLSQSGKGSKKELKDKVSKEVVERILRGKKNDAKFDFLKFIQVGDAAFIDYKLRVYTLRSAGTNRFTRTAMEGIGEGAKAEARLIFPPGIERALPELELERLRKFTSPEHFLKAVHLRSKDILSDTIKYFERHPQMKSYAQRLIRVNTSDSPLLRLGWGEGFLSTTVNLIVRERDEKLYEYIRQSLPRRTTPGNFPKTRRVVIDGRDNPIALPGWVKLNIEQE